MPTVKEENAGFDAAHRRLLQELAAHNSMILDQVIAKYGVSERLACRGLGQYRSTQRKIRKQPEDEAALTADIIALATQYGGSGYWRITALLRDGGRPRITAQSSVPFSGCLP